MENQFPFHLKVIPLKIYTVIQICRLPSVSGQRIVSGKLLTHWRVRNEKRKPISLQHRKRMRRNHGYRSWSTRANESPVGF